MFAITKRLPLPATQGNHMRRTMTAALTLAAVTALCACHSTSSTPTVVPATQTTASPAPTTTTPAPTSSTTTTPPPTISSPAAAPAPSAAAPAELSCSDIGGVFVAHGTDGRGDCEPADTRPKCHVPPAEQDGNYVPIFVLTPPFPNGTVSAAEVKTYLAMASNADCWKAPQ